jgi:hypothetical protein
MAPDPVAPQRQCGSPARGCHEVPSSWPDSPWGDPRPGRRHRPTAATLVACLLDTGAALTDQALELHDRLIGQFHGRSQQAHAERFQHSGRAINEKVRPYAAVGRALIAAKEGAGDPFAAIQAVLPWDALPGSRHPVPPPH